MTRQLEIGLVGRNAPGRAIVDRIARDALARGSVQVGCVPWVTEIESGIPDCLVDRPPTLHRRPINWNRASASMLLGIRRFGIVLEIAENMGSTSEDAQPSQPAAAHPVEGVGHAADRYLCVHGRTSPKPAASPVEAGVLHGGAARHKLWPLPRCLHVRLHDDRARIQG